MIIRDEHRENKVLVAHFKGDRPWFLWFCAPHVDMRERRRRECGESIFKFGSSIEEGST